VAVD
jgi:hypothetical protein